MDWNLPPDVHWLRHRRGGYDAAVGSALPEPDAVRDAVEVAILFCDALADPGHYRATLESLVVPESRPDWGDFSAAARIVRAVPQPDYGIVGTDPVRGTVTVAVESPLAAGARATVEMAWRERIGAWLVAGIA